MALAWWSARRDLISIATTQQTPTLEKIQQLKASVDQLLDELDRKVALIEQRIADVTALAAAPPTKPPAAARTSKSVEKVAAAKHSEPSVRDPEAVLNVQPAAVEPQQAPPTQLGDSRYGAVYAMADDGLGIEDIARKTGLGSAEVEMVISLRPKPGD